MAYYEDLLTKKPYDIVPPSLGKSYLTPVPDKNLKISQDYSYGGVKDFFKDVVVKSASDFLNSIISIPKLGVALNQSLFGKTEDYTPTGPAEQFLLGKEPIKPYLAQQEEASKQLKSAGFGKASTPIAILAVGGGPLLDLLGGSEESAAKAIVKITKLEDATNLLRKVGIAEDLVSHFAPEIVKVKKLTEAKDLVSNIEKVIKTTNIGGEVASKIVPEAQKGVAVASKLAKGGEDTINKLQENIKGYQSFGGAGVGTETPNAYLRDINTLANTEEGKSFTQKSVQDAIKSGEIKPNPDGTITLYRVGEVSNKNPLSSATYDKAFAESFDRTGKAKITEIKVNPEDIKYNIGGVEKEVLISKEIATGEKISGKASNAIERGFITSAKEAVPEASKIAGQYVPRDTDNLAIMAKNLIKDDINIAEKLALNGSDDKAVAVASELLKYYSSEAEKATSQAIKNALYDKAAQVANTIAPKLTEQGRAIQAASILGKLTPEGQVKFAAGQISKYNESVSLTKKIPELTGEQAKYILDEMKQINNMAEGTDKAIKFQKLQDYITKLVPTPLMKKIITVWKAGLLTGLKTTGVNMFANLSHAATETIKDAPATMADKIISLFTGKRSVSFGLKGLLGGAKEGANKGLQYMKTGFDERNIGTKLDFTKINFGEGKISKALQAYTDTVFRLMGSEDQPFYYAAKIRSFYEQAKVAAINAGKKGEEAQKFINELIQNPTNEMIKYASIDAETAVFQNQTALSKAASGITRAVPAAEVIIPFRRTPSAVAMQIINYTPLGIGKEVANQIIKRQFDQRLLSQAIGRGLTGTSLLGVGAYLATKGLITTARPTGEKEQKQWELEGKQANSIKIGGKWRQIQVLGPAGNVLLVGASFQNAYKDTGTISGAASQGLADASKAFTQQTFLTGVSNFIDAVSDPARSASYVIGSTLASTIPTFVSDVARATDTNERRANTIFDKFVTRIPGYRETLQPQVNVLGEEIKTPNPLEVMADPTRPVNVKDSPVISEIQRLSDSGFQVSPTLLGDKNGYKSLNPKQNTQLWERAGQIINGKLQSLFSSKEYQNLDDEQKSKIVNTFVDKSKIIARVEVVLKLTEGLSGDELSKKLSELKKSGLMTKEVFDKWQDLR